MDARGTSTSDDDSSQTGAAQGIREVTFYETTAVTAEQLSALAREAVREAAAEAESCAGDFRAALGAILCSPSVETMLLRICRVKIFSVELHKGFSQSNLELLGALKKLKYWYVMPQSSFLQLITTPASLTLRTVYAPLGRCVCVIDSRVD